jgi:hypothetical protein
MPGPRIFISHSTKEADAETAADTLRERLCGEGFSVFLDRVDLHPGVEWEDKVRDALDVCRGAVVVLSPAALESAWVRTEASVLTQRARRAREFTFVPLLMPGVDAAALDSHEWRPTGVGALQALRWEGSCPDALLASFAPLLTLYRVDSPLRELELKIAQLLAVVRPRTLELIGEKVGIDLTESRHADDRLDALAVRLLEATHDRQIDACLALGRIHKRSLAKDLYKLVAPHSWVAPEAAGRIRAVARDPRPRRLGIHAREERTCRMYVRSGDERWRLRTTNPPLAEDDAGELLSEVRAALAEHFGVRGKDPDAVIARELAVRPVFILLGNPAPPVATIDAVEARFDGAVMLVRPDDDGSELEGVEYVSPRLEPDDERRLLDERDSFERQV